MTKPIDFEGLHTYSLAERRSKVGLSDFARPHVAGGTVAQFLDSLPRILGAQSLRALVADVLRARERGKPILWGLGAHVLKCGLSPLLLDLMDRGLVTGLALNGAGIVHDFELAVASNTLKRAQEKKKKRQRIAHRLPGHACRRVRPRIAPLHRSRRPA